MAMQYVNAEWSQLELFLGGGVVAGGKMKEAGTLNWNHMEVFPPSK